MINKLHFPRTSCNGAFAVVAIHWLSTMVSGWKKLSQKSHSIGCQPWFTDGEKFSQWSHKVLFTVTSARFSMSVPYSHWA